MPIKVKITNDLSYAGKTMTILCKRSDGYHQALPFNITFAPLGKGVMTTPCFVQDEDAEDLFQALAQGLAESGYLPNISIDKQNELEATKYHLEDMRKLVFKEIR